MKLTSLGPVVVAAGLVLAARELGAEARSQRAHWPRIADEPYAPSPAAAPYVSLGYREVVTDLLWVRALGYFGGDGATSAGVRGLVEAMVALDPAFEQVLTWGSLAMQSIAMTLTNEDRLAVIAILERGMTQFPDNWNLPLRAGEIYARYLVTDDPAQRRAWKEKGAALLARVVRMPGAPHNIGGYVAHLQTELGQREQAIADLRELITYTSNPNDRARMIKKLAELTSTPSDTLTYELDLERVRFEQAWRAVRPELPPSMYLLAGPPLPSYFVLGDLANEPDLAIEPIEPLAPMPDDANGEVRP